MTLESARCRERVVLEGISPALDGGRHPVKRFLGETLEVGADIFKDGHDLVAARVLWRAPGAESFEEQPLAYDFEADRWTASLPLDRVGRWAFCVEGWPDRFRTFREELKKRVDAGQDAAPELLEGARLLRARASADPGGAAATLRSAAARLADEAAPVEARLEAAFDHELLRATWGPHAAHDLVRSAVYEVVVDRTIARFSAWYELFPRSQSPVEGRHGTFQDVEARLPELAELGFDVLYLPPIHPIGRAHRKGRNNAPVARPGDVGSPWAIGAVEGGHTAVCPELGTLGDFEHLVRAARDHGLEIALDYALQCAPDHPWVEEHPEWFHVRADGTIRHAENPPKKYEDIVPFDFWCADRERLWEACRDILLFWIQRGVRIFRVDNPHTKPLAFWEWCLAEVQARHPEVVFLSEAFTRPKRMLALAKLGFTTSYTYFTWKNTREELEPFLEEYARPPVTEYYRPHFFANTPDILHEYLQRGGRNAFRIRLLLAGTLVPVYGIYSGFELCDATPVREESEEYLDSEKYELKTLRREAPGDVREDVRRLNLVRREHPALQHLGNLRLLAHDSPHLLAYWRSFPGDELLVAVNLDPREPAEAFVEVPIEALGIAPEQPYVVEDLLTGERWTWRGAKGWVRLDPKERVGHVLRVHVPEPA
ncbi:MAG: alpha-1,4-glucan--maltose-1-phosphate maltosyltransferase [Polyangiaceae bacterium]|nr:alpha-1,4-glucan--maltose-1-phosphate maltosyltransferase [Polyangiaceae bacterium]